MAMRAKPRNNQRADSWRRGTSGLDGLNDRQRAEAQAAYKRWRESAAGAMADPRYSVADYVAYVQDRRAKEERNQAEEIADMPSAITAMTPKVDSIAPTSDDVADESRRHHLEALLAERYKSPAALTPYVQKMETDRDGRYAILHTSHGKIFDRGDRLEHSSSEMSAELAKAIIIAAAAKGWSSIRLTGGSEFKDALAIAAACHHPPIQTDHDLDKRGREAVRKLLLRDATASIQDTVSPIGGSIVEIAAARIKEEIKKCERLLATEPQGSRSAKEIAAPRLAELAERRERAKEDAAEALKAAAAHREAHGWATRLLDSGSRRRQLALDQEAAALDKESRRLDRRHDKSVKQIEREAAKEAKANATAHDDWCWSKEIRGLHERLRHLKSIETALGRGDDATVAAAANGDLRKAYEASLAHEAARQQAIRAAWTPEQRRQEAINAAVTHERSLGNAATVMERADAGLMVAACCTGDDATIRAASEGRIQDSMKAALEWERKERERKEQVKDEMERKEALERRNGVEITLG